VGTLDRSSLGGGGHVYFWMGVEVGLMLRGFEGLGFQ